MIITAAFCARKRMVRLSNSSVKHTRLQLEHQEEQKTRVKTQGEVRVRVPVANARENAVKVWRVNGNISERTAEARDVNGNKKKELHDTTSTGGSCPKKKRSRWERYNAERVRENQQ